MERVASRSDGNGSQGSGGPPKRGKPDLLLPAAQPSNLSTDRGFAHSQKIFNRWLDKKSGSSQGALEINPQLCPAYKMTQRKPQA